MDINRLPELDDLCLKHDLELLVLFGSQVKGKVHRRSDFDLAAAPKRGAKPDLLTATMDFSRRLQRGDVEMVFINSETSPLLLHEIFQSGRCLYAASANLFENWMVLAYKLYWDTEKLRRYRQAALERWLER